MKRTQTAVQEARKARMYRHSAKLAAKPYDVRKHRRATGIAVKWMRAELGPELNHAVPNSLVRMAAYYSHKRFARAMRRAAVRPTV